MARKHHAPFVPSPEDRAVAAIVGPDAAWIPAGDEVWAVRRGRAPTEPRSPLLELARAVWALDADRAHLRLRARIRVSSQPAPFDADVAKVVAHRLAWIDGAAPGLAPPVRWLPPAPEVPLLPLPPGPTDWRAWARSACRPAAPAERRKGSDRPVVAVLTDRGGRALGAAHNAAGRDRTAHAEVVLLRACWPVPDGCTLRVTLQCCRMCAALWAACAPADLQVEYDEPDPGPFAVGTALSARERRWA